MSFIQVMCLSFSFNTVEARIDLQLDIQFWNEILNDDDTRLCIEVAICT